MHIIKQKKITCFVFFATLFANQIYSQDNEFRGWSQVQYSIDLNKKWSLELSQHFRLKEDFNVVDSYITESEIIYSPIKKIKLSGQLRYYYKNDNSGAIQGFENMYRYRFGIEKRFNTTPLNFQLRVAFQNRISLDRENRFKKRIRIRPLAEIKIKDWENRPKLFYEYFNEVDGNKQKAHRYGISLKKELNKNQSFIIRYFFQKYDEEFNTDFMNNVISIKYSFN
tara:strand:- start:251 stop:925 length:675 start_codon:yes stop_codon:yes gene_type:complete